MLKVKDSNKNIVNFYHVSNMYIKGLGSPR